MGRIFKGITGTVAIVLSISVASAGDGTWKTASGGNWSDPLNWTGAVPNAPGDTATIGPSFPTADSTFTIDTPITLGTFVIDQSQKLTITGQPITLDAASGSAVLSLRMRTTPTLKTVNVQAPITLMDDLILTSSSNSSSGIVNIDAVISGDHNVTIQGGRYTFLRSNTYTGLTTVAGGSIELWSSSVAPGEWGRFGSTSAGLLVTGGLVGLQASVVGPIEIRGGSVCLYGGCGPYNQRITLAGGRLNGSATINTPLVIAGTTGEIASASQYLSLVLNGGTEGTGTLRIGNQDVQMIGPMRHTGDVYIDSNDIKDAKLTVYATDHTFVGGTTINRGVVSFGTSSGSLIGTGLITINTSGQLHVTKVAGNDRAANQVSPGQVVLAGGGLALDRDLSPVGFLAPTSTGGYIGIGGLTDYTAGGTNLLDFGALPAGDQLRLGSTDDFVQSSIASSMVLKPHPATRTLRFGAPSFASGQAALSPKGVYANELKVNAILQDFDGQPTHVEIDGDAQTFLPRANTYTGLTTINSGTVYATDDRALGDPGAGTVVNDGLLYVRSTCVEPLTIRGGEVTLSNAGTYAPAISMSGGRLRISFNNGVAQPITLQNKGTAEVAVDSSYLLTLNGSNGQGNLILADSGGINVDQPMTHDGGVKLAGSSVINLNTTNSFTGPLTVAHNSTFGMVNINADNHVSKLVMTSGTLNIAAGKTLTADAIDLRGGTISGQLAGVDAIEKVGYTVATLKDIGTSFNPAISVRQGMLNISGTSGLGSNPQPVRITDSRFTAIKFAPQLTINASFQLNNSSGFAGQGALLVQDATTGGKSTTINGSVDLGAIGSTVGVTRDYGSTLILAGPVSGGTLTVNGSTVALASDANTYSGATIVSPISRLSLTGNGTLAATSSIRICDGSELVLENKAGGARSDRLADSIPIMLAGGILTLQNRNDVLAAEQTGTITLERGRSQIRSYYDNYVQPAVLTLGGITRQQGTTVNFDGSNGLGKFDTSARIMFTSAPSLNNGIIAPWATAYNNYFATYGALGVMSLDTFHNDINTADSTKNVQLLSAATLTDNRTVNTLTFYRDLILDLNTKTLNVASGGIVKQVFSTTSEIKNGTLTTSAPTGELIVHANESLLISSTVADYAGAPLSFVKSGTGNVTLSGVNTYTGPTIAAAGTLTFSKPTALPPAATLIVDGGSMTLGWPSTLGTTATLGDVTLRSGAIYALNPIVTATSLNVEDGTIQVSFAGTMPMNKTTSGTVHLIKANSTGSAGWTGAIDIQKGILTADYPDALGKGNTTVRAGGRLVLNYSGNVNGRVFLDGGELAPSAGWTLAGDVDVLSNSSILCMNGLRGDAPIPADLQITGKLTVRSGATLNRFGEGTLTVTNGIVMQSGSKFAAGGIVAANLNLTGATVAPGYSPGSLTVTSTTFGPGGGYEWEINNAAGDAGAPDGKGWDLLAATGAITVSSTSANPFIVHVRGLGADGSPGLVEGFDPRHDYRWLIASAPSVTGFDPTDFNVDVTDLAALYPGVSPSNFSIQSDGGSMFLAYQVPEPAGLLLIVSIGLLTLGRTRRIRRSRDRSSYAVSPLRIRGVRAENLER